jgi:hypothetical protein
MLAAYRESRKMTLASRLVTLIEDVYLERESYSAASAKCGAA